MQQLMQLNIKKEKNQYPQSKIGGRSKYTLFQRRHTGGQEEHEKTLNITKYQRNTNQNYNEVSVHTSQNGHDQKNLQTLNAGEGVKKREALNFVGETVYWQSHYGKQNQFSSVTQFYLTV